ncbi:signal peptidase I [Candidatus Giovannonibacteria bacterium RIFCSPLOWO2_02_FULL_45_14]|nr:MAG: signal peptidase I [Candidatus Giovannonibacteria bacterium RIFCSPLOWO2_02_FULL_45_14]
MKKLLSIILNIAIYVAIVFAIVWGVPRLLAWKLGNEFPIAAITSGSMWPALKIGDIVLIKKVPKEEIKVGDIVVWQNQNGFTIHRVTILDENTLTTKGDGNFTDDPPVRYEDVLGKTVYFRGKPFRVPYFGYISVWAARR